MPTSDSHSDLQILTIVARKLYIGEACWAFLFGVIIGESTILCLVSCVMSYFAVPARAWRCSLVGQPSGSGAPSDSPVLFGCTSRDESPDTVTA